MLGKGGLYTHISFNNGVVTAGFVLLGRGRENFCRVSSKFGIHHKPWTGPARSLREAVCRARRWARTFWGERGGDGGVGEWKVMLFSSLLHDRCGTTQLALDLFASPSGSFDRALLEIRVGLCLLDHGTEPILSERISELSTRVGIREITMSFVSTIVKVDQTGSTNPITPIEDRIKDSLRFISCATKLRSWKMDST